MEGSIVLDCEAAIKVTGVASGSLICRELQHMIEFNTASKSAANWFTAAILIFSVVAMTSNISLAALSPEQAYFREHYTKYEYNIPMRDGGHLFTAGYAPKNWDKKYPILLPRTPYSLKPYGEDLSANMRGPLNYYAKEGFIFVLQDVRGRYGSEGTYVHVRPLLSEHTGRKDIDESTDAYDTIDWLVKQVPNNNGKVGMLGISYPGF